MSPRTVLITGGTGALGSTVTRRFLDDGHRVAATWVSKEEAEALAAEIGDVDGRLFLVETDVTDPDSIAFSLEDIHAALGLNVEGFLRAIGQPADRSGDAYTYCAEGAGGKPVVVDVVFDEDGKATKVRTSRSALRPTLPVSYVPHGH